MIDLSFGSGDRADRPAVVADAEFWRAAIRRHVAPAENHQTTPPAPPRCRQCRHTGPCAGRRRAERRLFGALRERWGGGAPGLEP
jgi:hypothetical protein